MATHSSVLAWRIPGTGEPGGLLSLGSHRVRHNWSDSAAAVIMVEVVTSTQIADIVQGKRQKTFWWCEVRHERKRGIKGDHRYMAWVTGKTVAICWDEDNCGKNRLRVVMGGQCKKKCLILDILNLKFLLYNQVEILGVYYGNMAKKFPRKQSQT